MRDIPYGYGKRIGGLSLKEGVAKVEEALKKQGFGVLTRIDLHRAFEEKLGITFRGYVILGACSPDLAHQAVQDDPQIGLLLPCNVVVQETDEGGVEVSIADPKAIFSLTGAGDNEIAAEADRRLRQVLGTL